MRKRRLDRNLSQKQVAEQIGVDITSVFNWESNESEPATRFLPTIIRFLGYNPLPEADSTMGRVRRIRITLGLTQQELAQRLGIDESTIAHWEQGQNAPIGPYRKLVDDFVNSDGSAEGNAEHEFPEHDFSPSEFILVRKSLGLSRIALARQLGISEHTLWRWERGDRKPAGLYLKLANRFMRAAW